MGHVFGALSSGLGRFVYGWLVPSAITLALFRWVMLPALADRFPSVDELVLRLPNDTASAILTFALAVLAFSAGLSLTVSVKLFRLLEGYSMPRALETWLTRRQLRKFDRWKAVAEREDLPEALTARAFEELLNFPLDRSAVMPTSLGNRLRAGETFPEEAFGLRILDLWFELAPAMDAESRRLVDDNRAGLDFYVSAIANAGLLTAAGVTTWLAASSSASGVLAVLSLALGVAAYFGAASQATEYALAVRASASTSRNRLALSLGYDLPESTTDEREFWQDVSFLFAHDPKHLEVLDRWRARSPVRAAESQSSSS